MYRITVQLLVAHVSDEEAIHATRQLAETIAGPHPNADIKLEREDKHWTEVEISGRLLAPYPGAGPRA